MGTEAHVDGGCLGAGPDRISGLPNDLVHAIMLHLPCTADTARISVLSRRWRGVASGPASPSFPSGTKPNLSPRDRD
ncbi:unnamed protein product [Urochloa humidicola]